MTRLDITRTRQHLQAFDFRTLFIEELGWNRPARRAPITLTVERQVYHAAPVAELGSVPVFEVNSPGGLIPEARLRRAVYTALPQGEKLLIFVDATRQNSLWYWLKTQSGRNVPREHHYNRNQPGDLFLNKLSALLVSLSELEAADGELGVMDVLGRLRAALDVERVTKKFYAEFAAERLDFAGHIQGIDDERDRQWYTSVLLNRLMFIYFLQKKRFVDGGDEHYLNRQLAESAGRGPDLFYREFLQALFFEAFARPEAQRSAAARKLTGNITYLNGGLFLKHPVELRWPKIAVPDFAFTALFKLFDRYTWHLDDTPGGRDDEINPAVLGYIFEKYINQKAFGAYYTRPEITEYLCERTIERLILEHVNMKTDLTGIEDLSGLRTYYFTSLPEMLSYLDAPLCEMLLDYLPTLSLLDPACGSGAFLVSAMKTLINVYSAVLGWIETSGPPRLKQRRAALLAGHPNADYFIKKQIIAHNLYGVDVMEEAVEIARLRLFLALVASAHSVDDLEPLPNIDFNLLAGNSLIGLLRVDEDEFNRRLAAATGPLPQTSYVEDLARNQLGLFRKSFRQLVDDRQRKLKLYKDTNRQYAADLQDLREDIQQLRDEANEQLNDILLDEFRRLGIKYEQAVWDAPSTARPEPRAGRAAEGPKSKGRSAQDALGWKKRAVTLPDVQALKPFHWGYEFDEVMNGRGGFDALITNPPWEIFKPQAKEFFAEHSELVTKNKMTIKEFEKEQAALLKNKAVRAAWLEYLSRFPHLSAYYRAAPHFANQIAVVNGKKAGSDINLYKLFTEQCYNLLRPGGLCGLVIPSGIYTDLGAKQLRELLFGQTQVTGLFGFENRKEIFEGVDSRFKFVVLTFEKGGRTERFPAAFMRHDVAELTTFPAPDSLPLSVPLIRKLSPDSLSVMEFKSELDARIAEKMLKWPLLGEKLDGVWNLKLTNEFHMTNDSHLFKTSPLTPGPSPKGRGGRRLPLYEGKMIHQFDAHFAEPRYWVDEKEGRAALLGKEKDTGQVLDYQRYRLGFRDIAASTNERSAIATLLPKRVFAGNTLPISVPTSPDTPSDVELLALIAIFDSFVFDAFIRGKITSHLNFFYVNQMPVPRLTAKDAAFAPLVARAARLICTAPEFEELWRELALTPGPSPAGRGGRAAQGEEGRPATDPAERAQLRAELDAMVAHLYELTEAEFTYILGAFPLVAQPAKDAALAEYRKLRPQT
jgi:hypothetical protein